MGNKRMPDESFEDYKARLKKEQTEDANLLRGSYIKSNSGLNHKERNRVLSIQRRARKRTEQLPIDETMNKISQATQENQETSEESTESTPSDESSGKSGYVKPVWCNYSIEGQTLGCWENAEIKDCKECGFYIHTEG